MTSSCCLWFAVCPACSGYNLIELEPTTPAIMSYHTVQNLFGPLEGGPSVDIQVTAVCPVAFSFVCLDIGRGHCASIMTALALDRQEHICVYALGGKMCWQPWEGHSASWYVGSVHPDTRGRSSPSCSGGDTCLQAWASPSHEEGWSLFPAQHGQAVTARSHLEGTCLEA